MAKNCCVHNNYCVVYEVVIKAVVIILYVVAWANFYINFMCIIFERMSDNLRLLIIGVLHIDDNTYMHSDGIWSACQKFANVAPTFGKCFSPRGWFNFNSGI